MREGKLRSVLRLFPLVEGSLSNGRYLSRISGVAGGLRFGFGVFDTKANRLYLIE